MVGFLWFFWGEIFLRIKTAPLTINKNRRSLFGIKNIPPRQIRSSFKNYLATSFFEVVYRKPEEMHNFKLESILRSGKILYIFLLAVLFSPPLLVSRLRERLNLRGVFAHFLPRAPRGSRQALQRGEGRTVAGWSSHRQEFRDATSSEKLSDKEDAVNFLLKTPTVHSMPYSKILPALFFFQFRGNLFLCR